MKPPEAVIFDCDGVLVDTEPAARRILTEELRGHGLEMSDAEIEHRFVGSTMERIREEANGRGLDLPPSWTRGVYDRLYAELAREAPLLPGVAAVLDALDAAGIPYAVGSNGEARKMEITLDQHPEIRVRFGDHVYSGQALGKIKPDPGLYLHAAAALGVKAGTCVVVDDSVNGCTAGVRAGMRVLGLAADHDGAGLARIGAEVIHSLAEVPGRLGLPR